MKTSVKSLVDAVEQDRIISRDERLKWVGQLKEQQQKVNALEKTINNITSQLNSANQTTLSLKDLFLRTSFDRGKQEEENLLLWDRFVAIRDELKENHQYVETLRNQLTAYSKKALSSEKEINTLQQRLNAKSVAFSVKDKQLQKLKQENYQLGRSLEQSNTDLLALVGYLDRLYDQTDKLAHSTSWFVSQTLRQLKQIIRRKKTRGPLKPIQNTFRLYQTWKKSWSQPAKQSIQSNSAESLEIDIQLAPKTKNLLSHKADWPSYYLDHALCPELREKLKENRLSLRLAYFLDKSPDALELKDRFVLDEIRYFVRYGFDVQLYSFSKNVLKDFQKDLALESIHVTSADDLADKLTKHTRTMLHANAVLPSVTQIVWSACEQAKIPFTFSGLAQDVFRYETIKKSRLAELTDSKWCLALFAPGRFHRDYFVKHGANESKIVINQPGIDLSTYNTSLSKLSNRPRITDGQGFNKKRICVVQSFEERSGIELLLEAAKSLKKMGIHLDLWGEGPLKDDYQAVLEIENLNNISFRGEIPTRQHLYQVLKDYDLIVNPSVQAADGDMDAMPSILIESMALGLPVVTANISSVPELIKDGVNGILFTAGDQVSLIDAIDRIYDLSADRIQYLVDNAQQDVKSHFSIEKSISRMLRVWRHDSVDIVIVSYNNLPELKEIIRRVYKYTTTPFKLIVVDNNSDSEVVDYLSGLENITGNFKFIPLKKNIMVGPGTNLAASYGESKYIIYLCGKEGFVLNFGWDQTFFDYMEQNSKVAMAGSLCYSPSHFDGKGYIKGHSEFAFFRNPKFAFANPDRPFKHVQGGLFVLRRKAFEAVGGFSEKIPHNSTDVEYSYYLESCGWQLGQIPNIIALYHLSRPDIHSKFDENIVAAHPLKLSNMEHFDTIIRGVEKKCNLCAWQGSNYNKGSNGFNICPQCGSDEQTRTLFRYLAEGDGTYRRLVCLDLNSKDCLTSQMKKMFDHKPVKPFNTKLFYQGRSLPYKSKSTDLLIGQLSLDPSQVLKGIVVELDRVLKPGGLGLFHVSNGRPAVQGKTEVVRLEGWLELLRQKGFETELVNYSSQAVGFDHKPMLVVTKPGLKNKQIRKRAALSPQQSIQGSTQESTQQDTMTDSLPAKHLVTSLSSNLTERG